MSTISTLIAQARAFVTTLRSSIWAIDVRDGIADSIQKLSEAIEQCYSDVSNPTLQTEALEAALQNKIDEGEMAALTIGDHTITAAKLAQGVIDNTLATSGAAADAKKTGDEIAAVKADLGALDIFNDDVKSALLTLVSHIALFDDGDGQEYCDSLRDVLYEQDYPDLRTGKMCLNAYLNENGEPVTANSNYYNEKYFPIKPDTSYIWVRGFDGFVRKINDVYKGACLGYRVCYYDENKEFISREVSAYSNEFGYIEQRYFELSPPEGAKFFRVSWSNVPVGNIYKSIPSDLYAVSMVLANLDDSEIESDTTLMRGVTITRNGVGIMRDVVYGRQEYIIPDFYGQIPNNNVNPISMWFRNVFSVLQGGRPETGPQNTDTLTRIQNRFAFLMKKGDVISFNGVKAGVRAERISDGYVQHTAAWITDNSDFVIGGES